MKILLVKPPDPAEIDFFKSDCLCPPLGLAYLAAALRRAGHQVQILDADVEGLNAQGVALEIKKIKPEVVGLSAVTPNFSEAVKIAKSVKKFKNPPMIILGGPHASAVPQAAKFSCFDFTVLGEGEETLTELVSKVKKDKTNFKKVKGLAFLAGRKLVITPPRPYLKNLDQLPFPAWDLMPPATAYHPTPGMYQNLPMMSMITSRGCPFRCTFCNRSVFGNTYRARSPKNVVDEMEILVKNGIREIKFYDDTFNLDTQRVIGICREILKRKLKLSWSCLCRVNSIEPEMLKLMKKSGCWQVSFGIESGNDDVLKAVRKGQTCKMTRQAVSLVHQAGIQVRGFFIIGLPKETEASMRQTIDFAKELNLEMANFYTLIPFPGTEIYQRAAKFGRLKKRRSFDDYLPQTTSTPPFIPYGLTEKKIQQYLKKAYREFYLRPTFLWEKILGIQSFSQIKKYVSALLAVLKVSFHL